MLVVFLIVPIWMLLFNMGYAGVRLQQAQVSTRLAAHEVLKLKTKGENAQGQSAAIADQVTGQVFSGGFLYQHRGDDLPEQFKSPLNIIQGKTGF